MGCSGAEACDPAMEAGAKREEKSRGTAGDSQFLIGSTIKDRDCRRLTSRSLEPQSAPTYGLVGRIFRVVYSIR